MAKGYIGRVSGSYEGGKGMIVRFCSCKHAFQDKELGPGLRWHTLSGKKGSVKETCMVCEKGR